MSTLNHLFDLQEEDQLCYVQCGCCATILLVTIPCGSLSALMTVRCGHCTTILAVDMMKAPFLPLHLFTSLKQDESPSSKEVCMAMKPNAEVCHQEDEDAAEKGVDLHTRRSPSPMTSVEETEDVITVNQVIKPPTKRQRSLSAYNCFIREEIQRLKKEFPSMTHKQAFSTAAKNWAYFPASNNKEAKERQGGEEPCKV